MPGYLPTLSTHDYSQSCWAADDEVPELATSPRSPASIASVAMPATPPQPVQHRRRDSGKPGSKPSASLLRSSSMREREYGPLDLQRAIGTGAFSKTYRATGLGHVFAVKTRLPSTDPEVFKHEESILRKLCNNVGVVRFYNDLSDEDHIVLDLYDHDLKKQVINHTAEMSNEENVDLFDFSRFKKPVIGLPQWLDYAQQLTSALKSIHEKNVVHADIKPENILCAGKSLVFADFSAAVDLDFQPASVLPTELGPSFALSPVYADPLVRAGLCLPSCQSDVYALGLVLAFCATNEEPYSGAHSAPQRLLWMDKIKPIDSYDAEAQQRLSIVRPVIDAFLTRDLETAQEALTALAAQTSGRS